MKRTCIALVVVAAVSLGVVACFERHDTTQVLRGSDCVACHLDDFRATSQPSHTAATANFPTTCADCHRTTSWHPALEGRHPAEQVFPIESGAHAKAACLTCHQLELGASRAGANTDCLQCHPNDAYQQSAHQGARSPTGVAYLYRAEIRNFCLSCHPKGTAQKHPNDKFPRTGEHNVACASCHDRSAGADAMGANTTCIESGCHHTLSWSDSKHREVRTYTSSRNGPWSKPFITSRNFCLLCHARGRN
ncbi:MAG: hypothetical protein R3B48_18100 [Kofleriaceae bacterium]